LAPAAYASRQPQSDAAKKSATVLVTGFGPFLEKVPDNPSWGVASRLPALIPASSDNPTPIHIHVHHDAIRVAYRHVVDLVPRLLLPNNPIYSHPDIILHIGLAAGRDHFAAEEGAWGRNYANLPDVDGECIADTAMEKLFPANRFPGRLSTSFNTPDVLARWKANLKRQGSRSISDVRISKDPGNFLCGFIYYNSLAHYYSITRDQRPVIFLHVPNISRCEEDMKEGIDVTIALIKALVQSWQQVGIVSDEVACLIPDKRNRSRGETDNNFSS